MMIDKFSLTDVFYCWNLLYRNTISSLFAFKFISYCAYLIIISISQFESATVLARSLQKAQNDETSFAYESIQFEIKRNFDRVLIIVESNERKNRFWKLHWYEITN